MKIEKKDFLMGRIRQINEVMKSLDNQKEKLWEELMNDRIKGY